MFKHFIIIISVVLLCALAINCAPGNERWNSEINPGSRANFWAGLWHGLIIIVAFVVSLFTNNVGIYEVNNVGWGYNLGFLIGLSLLFGPILRAGHHKKHITKRDWDRIGDTIEERVRKGIKSGFAEAGRKEEKEKEWEEIAAHIEQKIKDVLKDWK